MGPGPGSRRRTWLRAAYVFGLVCYLAGLLVWLGLGLLAPIVSMGVPNPVEGASLAAQYLFSALNLALGVLLAIHRPHDLVPRLVCLACLGTAATFNAPSHEVFHVLGHAPLITGVHFTFHIVSGVAYMWAVLLFPDGRLPVVGRGERWVAITAVVATFLVALVCWRSSFIAHPPFFVVFFGVLVPLVGMAAQTTRLRTGSSRADVRQQSRLLRMALAPALVAALAWLALRLVMAVGPAPSGPGALVPHAARWVESAFPAVFAVVPVMLFVGVLRYRLWDIDLVLSRGLLLVLLTGLVAALYAVLLGATSWFSRDHTWTAIATLTAAVLVAEPARRLCQRLANRLVFGQQLTPREAMRALTERLARPAPASELAELTSVVVAGTRCTSAAVWVIVDDELLLAARHPRVPAGSPRVLPLQVPTLEACRAQLSDATCLPVVHEGGLVAVLAVTLASGVRLPDVETRLLEELAGHAGLLVANARLTQGLAHQLDVVATRGQELRESRLQVVQAQDAARLRLERDIHDGAQQELVALVLQLAMAQRQASPDTVASMRTSLSAATRTLQDVVAGRTEDLVEARGLDAALEDVAILARSAGLEVRVRCRLPDRTPSDLAATVYFCVREAVQNVTKHAKAGRLDILVECEPGWVSWSVADDGVGVGGDAGSGRGLANLRERVTACGGSVRMRPARQVPGRPGTVVTGRLPMAAQMAVLGRQDIG